MCKYEELGRAWKSWPPEAVLLEKSMENAVTFRRVQDLCVFIWEPSRLYAYRYSDSSSLIKGAKTASIKEEEEERGRPSRKCEIFPVLQIYGAVAWTMGLI